MNLCPPGRSSCACGCSMRGFGILTWQKGDKASENFPKLSEMSLLMVRRDVVYSNCQTTADYTWEGHTGFKIPYSSGFPTYGPWTRAGLGVIWYQAAWKE